MTRKDGLTRGEEVINIHNWIAKLPDRVACEIEERLVKAESAWAKALKSERRLSDRLGRQLQGQLTYGPKNDVYAAEKALASWRKARKGE